jgi:hypothetical protein
MQQGLKCLHKGAELRRKFRDVSHDTRWIRISCQQYILIHNFHLCIAFKS